MELNGNGGWCSTSDAGQVKLQQQTAVVLKALLRGEQHACLLTQCYNKGYSGDVGMSRIRDMHAWLQADSSACKSAAFKHTASSAAHELCCCVFHVATAHLDRS